MIKDTLFSFVDLETTGGSPGFHRIIEVAVIQVLNGKVVNTYEQLLCPHQPLPPFISTLTGITESMLEGQPTFEDIAGNLYQILEGSVFVAHNAMFDYGFLKAEFERAGYAMRLPTLCTVRLSRKLFPHLARHGLDHLIDHFDLSMDDRHRAMADTHAIWQFCELLPKHHSAEHIETTVKQLLQKYVLPPHVPKEDLDALPNSPGVYVFHGEYGHPLYVGKSIHIRDRVFQHFAKAHDSSKELAILKQLRHVETHTTCGEMGALLLESELIKTLQPEYNRRLRKTTNPLAITGTLDDDGYMLPSLVPLHTIPLELHHTILGIVPTKHRGKQELYDRLTRYRLCAKRLLLEASAGACFQHQLDRCLGACLGQEDPLHYNQRIEEAFASTRIKSWPYQGPVLVVEHNEDRTLADLFLLDQWTILARGQGLEDGSHTMTPLPAPTFQKDLYSILVQYLSKAHPGRSIRVLSELEVLTYLQS